MVENIPGNSMLMNRQAAARGRRGISRYWPILSGSGAGDRVSSRRLFPVPAVTCLSCRLLVLLAGINTCRNGHISVVEFGRHRPFAAIRAAKLSTPGVGSPRRTDCAGVASALKANRDGIATTIPSLLKLKSCRSNLRLSNVRKPPSSDVTQRCLTWIS